MRTGVIAPPNHSADHLRVVHLITSLGVGGAERSLVELLPYFRQAGLESTILILRETSEGFEGEARARGFLVERLPGNTFWSWVPQCRRRLRELRPHLLHTTLFEADVVGRLASIAMSIPVVTSLVNTSYEPERIRDPHLNQVGFALVRVLDAVSGLICNAHFHAITETVKQSYQRHLWIPDKRITVIGRGRSRSRLGSRTVERGLAVRRQLAVPRTQALLLAVGRQEYSKGHCHLIQAMDLLKDDCDPLLLVAGPQGAESHVLRQEVEKRGLQDRVRFLGYRDDVPDLMTAADILVFPSLFEGLGGAVLEAMALELPVVASDIPVLREVLGEGAVFVPPASPERLAAALRNLIRAPEERARLAALGSARFKERFELGAIADRMVALFRCVATGQALGPRVAPAPPGKPVRFVAAKSPASADASALGESRSG